MRHQPANLDQLPSRQLIAFIAGQRCMRAWCELVGNRTLFQCAGVQLLLHEYIQVEAKHHARRRRDLQGRIDEICDIAFDRLGPPVRNGRHAAVTRDGRPGKPRWDALLKTIESASASEMWSDTLTEELRVAEITQRFVRHQVKYAVREVRRDGNPARSRYRWRRSSSVLHLWMPRDVSGRARRRWLLAHALGNGSSRAADRQRVQAAIDSHFGARRQLHVCDHLLDRATYIQDDPALTLARKELAEGQLPAVVAREKATNLPRQRQAIRALGPVRLEELVLTVFDALAAGHFREREIAREFGLSAATLSRFAGARWRDGGGHRVPDLWANVAQVVAGDPIFRECAESAGVWPHVQGVADSVSNTRCQG